MQWLARAVPMGPDGSIGFGVAEHGPVPDPPVSARAFGAPFAPSTHWGGGLGKPLSFVARDEINLPRHTISLVSRTAGRALHGPGGARGVSETPVAKMPPFCLKKPLWFIWKI